MRFDYVLERMQSHGKRSRTDAELCAEVLSDENAAPGCWSQNPNTPQQSADDRCNEGCYSRE
jgi:hypothetical protein